MVCDGQREGEETLNVTGIASWELPRQDIIISVAWGILVPSSSGPGLNRLSGRGQVALVSGPGVGRGA